MYIGLRLVDLNNYLYIVYWLRLVGLNNYLGIMYWFKIGWPK